MSPVPERAYVAPVFFTIVRTARSPLVFSPLILKKHMTALSATLQDYTPKGVSGQDEK